MEPIPAYKGSAPYIFVCYAHADSEFVYPELVWLREHGCNSWYDEGIVSGEEWPEELAQAIKGASHFMIPMGEKAYATLHQKYDGDDST